MNRSRQSFLKNRRSRQSFLKIGGIISLTVNIFLRSTVSIVSVDLIKRSMRAIRSGSIFFKDQKDQKIRDRKIKDRKIEDQNIDFFTLFFLQFELRVQVSNLFHSLILSYVFMLNFCSINVQVLFFT